MEVLALAAAAGGAALAAWIADRRRARLRNGRGMCAACGEPWRGTADGAPVSFP